MALLLIGGFTGFYALALFGFFLLFPALLISSEKPTPGRAGHPREMPARIPSHPPPPAPEVAANPPVKAPSEPQPQAMPAQPATNYALFPGVMFPPMSLTSVVPTPQVAAQQEKGGRDELLEYGVILALLRVLAG